VKNSGTGAVFRSQAVDRLFERAARWPNVLPHALVLLVAVPSAALAALYLTELHTGSRAKLEQAAHLQTESAAAGIDRDMLGLVRSLKALPPGSLKSAEDRNLDDACARAAFENTGITFFVRDQALNFLGPADNLAWPNAATPDASAHNAAAKAISTHQPQTSPYPGAADKVISGINLWLASAAEDSTPVLLQLSIPSSFFTASLGTFVTDSISTFTLRDAAGDVFARTGPKGARAASSLDETIESFADIPRFGWQVAATMPLAALNASKKGNWISFLFVVSLITGVALALATLLSRRTLEPNYASPWLPRLFAERSAQEVRSRRHSNDRMLMPHPDHGLRKRGDRQNQPDEIRLRMALGSSGVGAWEWNVGSNSIEWDDTLAKLLRASPDAPPPSTKDLLKKIEASDRGRLLAAVRNALTKDQPLAIDIRVRRFDGHERWLAVRGAAIKGEHQPPSGLVGIVQDVTDQKQSLSRTDALLREVSHRSKNMLALILAMARLTARDTVDVKSHLKEFALRVAGLAASQDLIVASDWQSVDLGTLAVAEIDAVARTDAARVKISGPSFAVTPEAAQTVGMILTELTLNAIQHGALSVANGEVRLTWELTDDATIMISWQEIGGPGYDPGRPPGYGMSVVERFSTQGLKASAHARGDASGFLWVLNAPVASLGGRPPPHRA
jgi:two-component sensor histidine kinase